LFFLLADSFYRVPLEIRCYSSGPKLGKFYIVQKNGGPAITLLCLPPLEQEGQRLLPPGMVSYYSTYLNPDTGQNQTAPAELVAFFGDLCREIKANGQAVKMGPRTLWLGRHAEAQMAKGLRLVGVDT
jgi:hypothetical protein